jgi:hypothetical protein
VFRNLIILDRGLAGSKINKFNEAGARFGRRWTLRKRGKTPGEG